MKNIREFEKLFKLNFPIEENFEYYVKILNKSPEYSEWLNDTISDFEELEQFVEKMGYKSVKSYKLDYALLNLKEYIKNSKAYERFQEAVLDNSKLRTKDELRKNDDTYLISIDLKSANYNALKTFDESSELFGSWEELCVSLDIHPILAKSKSFRQFVFGNTSPSRLTKIQHVNIIKIIDKLIENKIFIEEDFIFISHDEFIVRLQPDHKLSINRIHLLNSEIGRIISEESINMPTHYNVFKLESLGKNKFVKTHYNVKMGGLSEKYTSLVGVPGNEFFKYFKKYILKEDLDERDLYFYEGGKLAKWVV